MPDIYQGTELWDLTMVDPDNRRPVDFQLRAAMLDEVRGQARSGPCRRHVGAMRASWQDGRIKLAVIATILGWRGRNADLFAEGDYAPVEARGPQADQVFAFTRRHGDRVIVVAVARFPGRRETSPFDARTSLALPEGLGSGWTDLLTGRDLSSEQGLTADRLFEILPAVVLVGR